MKALILNEYLKIKRKKSIYIFMSIEILIFCYYVFFEKEIFYITENPYYILEEYYSIILLINYIFTAILVSTLFSKEIENGTMEVSISFPYSRFEVMLSKILTIFMSITLIHFFQTIVNIFIHVLYNYTNHKLIFEIIRDTIYFELLNLIPLLIFSLLIIMIDMIVSDSNLVIFFVFLIIILPGILPDVFSKFIITYYINLAAILNFTHVSNWINFIIISLTYIIISFLVTKFIFLNKDF